MPIADSISDGDKLFSTSQKSFETGRISRNMVHVTDCATAYRESYLAAARQSFAVGERSDDAAAPMGPKRRRVNGFEWMERATKGGRKLGSLAGRRMRPTQWMGARELYFKSLNATQTQHRTAQRTIRSPSSSSHCMVPSRETGWR